MKIAPYLPSNAIFHQVLQGQLPCNSDATLSKLPQSYQPTVLFEQVTKFSKDMYREVYLHNHYGSEVDNTLDPQFICANQVSTQFSKVEVVSINDYLCQDSECKHAIKQRPMCEDGNHINRYGS